MNASLLPRLNASLAVTLALLYAAWWLAAGAPVIALPLTAMLFAVVPLLALAPALWNSNRFATSLAGFILPFHFAFAVMELVANPDVRGWVAAQLFLSLLLLIGVMSNMRQVRAPQER